MATTTHDRHAERSAAFTRDTSVVAGGGASGDDEPLDPDVVAGLACFGAAIAPLPAHRSTCFDPATASAEEVAQRLAQALAAGWNLASLSPLGSALLGALDAAGARIEVAPFLHVVPDSGSGRPSRDGCTTSGSTCPACTARLGRRARAMGTVIGPGGQPIQLSCRAVLALPRDVALDPAQVALCLIHHACWHVADLLDIPSCPDITRALTEVAVRAGLPASRSDIATWAWRARAQAAAELRITQLTEGLCNTPPSVYSDN